VRRKVAIKSKLEFFITKATNKEVLCGFFFFFFNFSSSLFR
jgi:hypothetical protein